MAVATFENGSGWLLAAAGGAIAFGFVLRDFKRAKSGALTPITVFAFASALAGLANATGLLAANTPYRSEYFTYAADDYLLFAAQLAVVGSITIVVGFKLAAASRSAQKVFGFLPRVRGNFSDRMLLVGGPLLAIGAIVMHAGLTLGLVGSVLSTIYLIPHIVAFLLARASTERRLKGAMILAFSVALLEGGRALFMAYLRTDIVAPFIAVGLGALLGARSLAPLRTRQFAPLYVIGAVFVIYFGAFAQARKTSSGIERLQAVTDATPNTPGATEEKSGFWARLTNFNQLSQIGRITSQDGFLHGQTLQYLGFVFVPRFLWPDKPIVQKGGWFAWRIGQAWIRPDGRYSNAVNMTVPGELYLNFGWLGVLVGCTLFGAFIAMLWSRVAFWSSPGSGVGTAFGYYLFWTSLALGADLQTVVTLLASYCIFVAAGVVVRVLPHQAPAHVARAGAWWHADSTSQGNVRML